MKHTRLEKELIEAGKELRLIQEGKMEPQSLDELISEMRVKHGGRREGAGRKTDAKKTKYIRVTPEEKDFLQKVRESKEQFLRLNKTFEIKIPALNKAERMKLVQL